ncbi:MAG TPA: FtsQ-type POTRA domain-containing protein [Acidimicrobiales bacterium]|nr:FtsQ-type POTRA domain-containing protein [Acidimicrobiales bacterium]
MSGPPSPPAAPTRAVPPVDPRLRARRIEVARHAGRRRLVRLLVAVVATAVVAAGWGLTRSPLLDVDHVEVRGATHTGVDAVRAAAGVSAGTPLLEVDPPSVRAAVGALAWVEHVSVTRDWPGTLRVAVRERTPVARVGTGPDGVRGDRRGRVLGPVASGPADADALVVIEGPDIAATAPGTVLADGGDGRPATAVDRALAVAERLPATLAAASPLGIEAIEVGADGAVSVRLGTGVARLGAHGEVDDQLAALATVLTRVDLTCLATIDVRVPSAPAVTRSAPSLTDDAGCR